MSTLYHSDDAPPPIPRRGVDEYTLETIYLTDERLRALRRAVGALGEEIGALKRRIEELERAT